MSGVVFDVEAHRRERLRRAEARADWLDRERVRLERLLAVCLRVATSGTGVAPLDLLDLIERLDRLAQKPPPEPPPIDPARPADLLGGPS